MADDATAIDLAAVPQATLAALAKASQKHQLKGCHGAWASYVMQYAPKGSGADPARQSRQVLEAYTASLLSPCNGNDARGNEAFVRSYLSWAATLDEEQEHGLDVLPPEASTSSQVQNTVWSLVGRTRAHPKYAMQFRLPSYQPGWKRTQRTLLSSSSRPRLIALDCEMCATEDDDSALLGVCVVDEFGAVLFRELVRPEGAIKDLRTALTGVSEADLQGVTLTAKKACKAVRKLIKAAAKQGGGCPVVLVGHALHHDLRALKLDHQPVIDTSLVFAFKGLPECTPGLKDCAKLVLGLDMRTGGQGSHDSLEDATVSMRLVMHELQLARPTPLLEAPQERVSAEDLRKLMLHGIPANATHQQLLAALAAPVGSPTATALEGDLEKDRKVLAVFKHAGDANEAFKRLPGEQRKDSLGRFYKEASLGPGLSFKVRKMACHNGMAYGNNRKPVPPAVAAGKGAKDARHKDKHNGKRKRDNTTASQRSTGPAAEGAGQAKAAGRKAKKPKQQPVIKAGGKPLTKLAADGKHSQSDGL